VGVSTSWKIPGLALGLALIAAVLVTLVADRRRGESSLETLPPGASPTPTPRPARTLKFPSDRVVGRVFAREQDDLEAEAKIGLGLAQGEVRIPAGMDAILLVTDRGFGHLEALAELSGGELDAVQFQRDFQDDGALVHLASLGSLKDLRLAYTDITDAGLEHLRSLKGLRKLDLEYTLITDAGAPAINALTELTSLSIAFTQITGVGLAALDNLKRLQMLDLGGLRLVDADLVHLTRYPALRELRLGGTEITDAGIAHLRKLRQLEALRLNGTRITYGGLEILRRALPDCMIRHNPPRPQPTPVPPAVEHPFS